MAKEIIETVIQPIAGEETGPLGKAVNVAGKLAVAALAVHYGREMGRVAGIWRNNDSTER